MLDFIERANTVLDRWLMAITGIALIFSTLLCFIGVVLRYGFGISYEWNEELCRYAVLIIVYFWAGSMIRNKQHIYFSLLSDTLKGKSQDVHRFITSILTAVLGIPLLIWGIQLTAGAAEAELQTMSLIFPLWPAYAIIPVGVALIVVQAVFDIIRLAAVFFTESPKKAN